MARQDYGNNLLTKQLQPGSKFTITKAGFDTGRRVWKCDSTKSLAEAPVIGQGDSVYGAMFVSNVEITTAVAGIDDITVDYLGLIRGSSKADDYTMTFRNEVLGSAPDMTGTQWANRSALTPSNFVRPLPVVTHVYLQTSEPSRTLVGAIRKPPKYSDFDLDTYYANRFRVGYTRIFADWVLTERAVRTAGASNLIMHYEVTDTYTFTVNEVKLSN